VRRLTDFPEAWAVLDRRLDRNTCAPVALALSGGGDSMALLHLAQAWADQRGRRLIALTVDHGLNAASAGWTAAAGKAAHDVGADWRALPWIGEKPNTSLPAAARTARHRLLANAAREAGAAVILLAHTANDVAEGDLMRSSGTPTLGHLREWSPSPVWPEGRGLFILRPFLKVRRTPLRIYLSEQGVQWLEDPANDDIRYARPRARAALVAYEALGAVTAQQLYDGSVLPELAEATVASPDGRLSIRRTLIEDADRISARRFLAIAAICASGRPAPPRGPSLDRLQARLSAEQRFVATLAGARITVEPDHISFTREAGDGERAGLAPLHLKAGETAVWDGRFEVRAQADVAVVALSGYAASLHRADRPSLAAIPAEARPSLPVLLHEGGAVLPRPFGAGPASARALAQARLRAACDLVSREAHIASDGMAEGLRSSYVEAMALA